MEELLGLLGKNKKSLFKYVEDNKIECYKVRKNIYRIKILFLNVEHICKVHIYKKIICTIHLFVNDEKGLNILSFNEFVNKYKEYFNLKYGNPISDNTNHPTDNISITYEKDCYVVSIFGQMNQLNITISTFNNEDNIKKHEMKPLLKYAIYLAGGLFWGLMMFLTMSYKDYSWLNFGIWMGAGFVWALLFGVIFELVMHITPKQDKINLKQIKKIEEKESELVYTIDSCGELFLTKKTKNKRYTASKRFTAKFYINQNDFIILYYKKRTIYKIEEKIDLLSKELGFGYLSFQLNDTSASFRLQNNEEFSNIKKHIDKQLGYTSSRFMEIYSFVKKILIEYNPYSLYKGDNESVFDCESEIISRRIFENPAISLNDFKEVMLVAFDYDYSIQICEDLTTILYDSIIKKSGNDIS